MPAATDEWQVYRRSPQRRLIHLAVAAVGVALVVFSLIVQFYLWGVAVVAGAVLMASGLGPATEAMFLTDPDGVTVKRGGYLAIDKLVQWSSIRALEVVSDKEALLHLIDGSHVELRLGALTEPDRTRLIIEIQQRTRHGAQNTQ